MEKPHKKLDVWKISMELVKAVYLTTSEFPKQESYGLTSQIQRAAVSIPSNIAEGAARQTKKEFINFLHIAQGSLSELDTQLDISMNLGYLGFAERAQLDELLVRVDKMLTAFIRSLKLKKP
jgi:four helix bundle protein